MDQSDPGIVIDKNGVCDYCKAADERKKIDHSFVELVHQIVAAGRGKKYDCLIGLSGGVDSSTVAHLVNQLGLKPLAIIFDNGWNTKIAGDNIKNIITKLKLPYLIYQPPASYRELQVTFLGAGVSNAEIPTDHVLVALLYRTALKNKIKYIISGGNTATEGTMPEAWSYSSKDLFHIKQIYKKFAGKQLRGVPTMNLLQYIYCRAKIKTINLLDYQNYNQKEAKKMLAREYDWQDYGNKHCENVYTRWYQQYYLPVKFGIDKRKAHLSSLIQSRQMTREEALEELKKVLVDEDSPRVMAEFGFSMPAFQQLMKLPPIPHMNYPNHKWLWDLASKIYRSIK